MKEPYDIGVKRANISGILFGASQLALHLTTGIIFYVGAIFTRDFHLDIADVFTAIFAIIFSAMSAGNSSHFLPDISKAKNSAASIFQILD